MTPATTLAMVLAIMAANVAHAADAVKLEPNATLRFEFADLPDTLATKFTGEKQPARLTAELPDNYSSQGKFPLFIFLHGGHGGHGEPHISHERRWT